VHDPNYRASLKDFDSFLEALTEKIMEVDETIPELPIKDIVSTQKILVVECMLMLPRYFAFIEMCDFLTTRYELNTIIKLIDTYML
jgi:hypothetical protein